MPIRTYVAPTEYDPTQEHFTVATIAENLYLQIGALSTEPENQKFIESLIDGQTGFFQEKKRIGRPVRYNTYTRNGIPIDSIPELAYGEAYHIRFTQARPGRDGKDGSALFNSFLNPFPNEMRGRFYGSMTPYPKHAMNPFPDSMSDKFHSSMHGYQANETEETATDLLDKLNGQPDLVRDFIWNLIMERVPELRDANTIYNLILPKLQEYTKPYTQPEKDKLLNIEPMATADQSAAELIALLNALPRGSRLNINWFDGELNIPTNTVEWHGQFQLLTAYGAGDMVIDSRNIYIYIADVPATNTTRPGSDTRAEHLDAGSPADLVDATKSGLTFTLVRRSGDNINLTITNADIVRAFQSMTTTEKARIRTTLAVPTTSHTHDSRYYTEAESNSRFAPRTTISATAANVLAALVAMNTAQEGQARAAIKAEYISMGDWDATGTNLFGLTSARTDGYYIHFADSNVAIVITYLIGFGDATRRQRRTSFALPIRASNRTLHVMADAERGIGISSNGTLLTFNWYGALPSTTGTDRVYIFLYKTV